MNWLAPALLVLALAAFLALVAVVVVDGGDDR